MAFSAVYLYFFAMPSRRTAALAHQRRFLARLGEGFQLATLFDTLPSVAFFAKDAEGRFVRANGRLLQIFGCQQEWQVLGRTDFEFLPADAATMYVEEDRRVMRSGRGMSLHIQMVPDVDGPVRWYLVAKVPLRDRTGLICGIAGAMYESHEIRGTLQPFHRIEPALRHLHANHRQPLTTPQLARLCHLSGRQFARLFNQLFGEGPMRYLVRQRIHSACHQLIATDQPAGTIALDHGFYDQSAFTRAFRAFTGTTPSGYRRRHLARCGVARAMAPA